MDPGDPGLRGAGKHRDDLGIWCASGHQSLFGQPLRNQLERRIGHALQRRLAVPQRKAPADHVGDAHQRPGAHLGVALADLAALFGGQQPLAVARPRTPRSSGGTRPGRRTATRPPRGRGPGWRARTPGTRAGRGARPRAGWARRRRRPSDAGAGGGPCAAPARAARPPCCGNTDRTCPGRRRPPP